MAEAIDEYTQLAAQLTSKVSDFYNIYLEPLYDNNWEVKKLFDICKFHTHKVTNANASYAEVSIYGKEMFISKCKFEDATKIKNLSNTSFLLEYPSDILDIDYIDYFLKSKYHDKEITIRDIKNTRIPLISSELQYDVIFMFDKLYDGIHAIVETKNELEDRQQGMIHSIRNNPLNAYYQHERCNP